MSDNYGLKPNYYHSVGSRLIVFTACYVLFFLRLLIDFLPASSSSLSTALWKDVAYTVLKSALRILL